MVALKFAPFGPTIPRTAERQLPDGYAQVATNVNLLSGEIRPIKQPLMVDPGLLNSLAVFRAENPAGAEKWRGWTMDVDVAQVPLADDVEYRYVWTGDGPPRWTKYSSFTTPANDKQLGIPKPVTAPTVSPSGGTGATVTRLYVYTFFSADGEESAPSPISTLTTGKVDDTWAISNMDGFPLNTGSVSTAVKDTPSAGFIQVTTTAAHWLRAGDQITITGVVGMTDLNGSWTVTSIVDSTKFVVTKATSQTYTSGGTWTRVAAWNTTSMTRRLYRSAGTNATFQLVAENISGTSYNDTITDYLIPGDELLTDDWLPPPVDLIAIQSMPNGAMVGISGTKLCFSEPYQAHAWPAAYQFGMAFGGVGLATYGTTVVVGTKGMPYIADGVDPASTTLQRIDNSWPCLAKRSMVSVGDGVLYATLHGLAYIGAEGPRMWTQSFYTREEWQILVPSSMVAAVAEQKVFLRCTPSDMGTSEVIIFQPSEQMGAHTILAVPCQELYADQRNGRLYLVDTFGVKLYDASEGLRLTYEWMSKEHELPKPVNLGAARVEFESEMTAADFAAAMAVYNAAVAANAALIANGVGAINGRQQAINRGGGINGYTPPLPQKPEQAFVNFTLYSKGVVVFASLRYTNESFALPAGYKSDAYAVKVSGTVGRVKNIKVAETMQGLEQV